MRRLAAPAALALAACGLLAAAPAALAQQGVTNAFAGFGNSKDPIKIEAQRLEVRQKDETAVFIGDVVVVQGESVLHTKQLRVLYVDSNAKATPGKPLGAPGPGGRELRRLEAEGDVVVTAKDQRASGDKGVFDMPSNTAVLTGNVLVSQGTNILKGERLRVNLTTQESTLEGGPAGNGRVQAVFTPGAAPKAPDKADAAAPATPKPKPAPAGRRTKQTVQR
jgi:lipopolysaccharide export system protein LptA